MSHGWSGNWGIVGRARVWTPSQEAGQVTFDFWPCRRPLTKRWGSGTVWGKLAKRFGEPDAAFGKTDGIPEGATAIDLNTGHDWKALSFPDNHFAFGYWDPPYDKLYRPEGREIWRCVRRLAILHTHIYPRSWFDGAIREGMVAITMGPLKQMRCLQVFRKAITTEVECTA